MQTEPVEQQSAQAVLEVSNTAGAAQPTSTNEPNDRCARHSGMRCGNCPCRGLCGRTRRN